MADEDNTKKTLVVSEDVRALFEKLSDSDQTLLMKLVQQLVANQLPEFFKNLKVVDNGLQIEPNQKNTVELKTRKKVDKKGCSRLLEKGNRVSDAKKNGLPVPTCDKPVSGENDYCSACLKKIKAKEEEKNKLREEIMAENSEPKEEKEKKKTKTKKTTKKDKDAKASDEIDKALEAVA